MDQSPPARSSSRLAAARAQVEALLASEGDLADRLPELARLMVQAAFRDALEVEVRNFLDQLAPSPPSDNHHGAPAPSPRASSNFVSHARTGHDLPG